MQFSPKFWLIFSLILSDDAPNVDFREANFKISRGSMPRTPYCTHAIGARSYFSRTNSELLPPGLYFYLIQIRVQLSKKVSEKYFQNTENGISDRVIFSFPRKSCHSVFYTLCWMSYCLKPGGRQW